MNYFRLAYTTPEVLEKIKAAERKGNYNDHIDPIDYNSCLPVDEKFPYIPTGMLKLWQALIRIFIINPFMCIVNRCIFHTKIYINGEDRNHKKSKSISESMQMQTRKDIDKNTAYNNKNKCGMIITCNHINKLDALVVRWVLIKSGILRGRRLKVMVADFNNQKGRLGEYMRAFGILPFPSGHRLVRLFDSAVSYYLERGDCILVFPEQSEWWGYDRPRPLKNGAFYYAAKNNVPVQPLFITCRNIAKDSTRRKMKHKAKNEVEKIYFDVDILDRIEVPQDEKNIHEKTRIMREKNSLLWQKSYVSKKRI